MPRRSPAALDHIEAQVVTAVLARGVGMEPLAMPELAKAAGLAVGTLYRLAPGKAALSARVEAAVWGRFDAAVFAPFPARLDLAGRFAAMWARLSAFVLEDGAAARFLADRPLPAGGSFLRASAAFARDGAQAGLRRDLDGPGLAALVWGPAARLARDGTATPERLAALGAAIWAGLLAPAAPG
jgi:AcrR family transcriptional regulator